MILTRRQVLGGIGASALVGTPALGAGQGLIDAYPEILKFRVTRDGNPIGTVMERFRTIGDDIRVDVYIRLEVDVLFFTAFRYEHRSREIWRRGRLVRLDTVTDDDGDAQMVRARADAGKLAVSGPAGQLSAPAAIFPSSYWHPRFVEQTRMLDSQRGRLLEIRCDRVGDERIVALGREIDAARYRMSGDIDLDFWYSADGVWQKMAFTIKGGDMEYVRVAPSPGDDGLFATPMASGARIGPLTDA